MDRGGELLTVDELAEALRVPKSWIYSRTRTNSIPCVRVGKYARFRLSDVLADLERRGKGRGVERR